MDNVPQAPAHLPPVPPRQLRRSRTNRMVAGVCSGLAEYSGIDVTIIRLAFVALTVFGGGGLILYLIAIVVMPAGD